MAENISVLAQRHTFSRYKSIHNGQFAFACIWDDTASDFFVRFAGRLPALLILKLSALTCRDGRVISCPKRRLTEKTSSSVRLQPVPSGELEFRLGDGNKIFRLIDSDL
jgi:hypothetical protein